MNPHVTTEKLHNCIDQVLEQAAKRPRKFLETVQLIIALKRRRHRSRSVPSIAVRLKHVPKPHFRVCVLGDKDHFREARANRLGFKDKADILELNKSTAKVSKLLRKFDAFLISRSLVDVLPNDLMTALKGRSKEPVVLTPEEFMSAHINKLKINVKLEARTAAPRVVTVGHVKMTREELSEDITLDVDSLVSLLKNHWLDVRRIIIKSCMGPPQRLY
ncbi:hypothetical protein HPB48_022404 [Haemaphysalis longicornis]|uniref:Large ribosomal subunit protein uL1 n=1 Tax=Haemaphysalis longicornis TaxID=44386 RepID=A0A9J6GE69_HAELO|nr:hypothetical protein HPB48_022404 [Haemaphysalis longicornis]